MTDSRLYPARPYLAASLAVFRDGKVLLATRATPPFDTIYSLPGGMVEPGETLEEAARRELMEETGVAAEVVGFAGHAQAIDRDEEGAVRRHFVIVSFAGRWLAGEGEPSVELPRMLWADEAEAAAMRLTPGLLPILQRGWALLAGVG